MSTHLIIIFAYSECGEIEGLVKKYLKICLDIESLSLSLTRSEQLDSRAIQSLVAVLHPSC